MSSLHIALFGPQPMIQAARTMLEDMSADKNHNAFDEFKISTGQKFFESNQGKQSIFSRFLMR